MVLRAGPLAYADVAAELLGVSALCFSPRMDSAITHVDGMGPGGPDILRIRTWQSPCEEPEYLQLNRAQSPKVPPRDGVDPLSAQAAHCLSGMTLPTPPTFTRPSLPSFVTKVATPCWAAQAS